MTATEKTTPESATSPVDAQAAVAQMRGGLLGGRGPGASRSEFLRHTRARVAVGGVPVPALRESVALDAARARRDTDALAEAVEEQRDRLAADLDLLSRVPPRASGVGAMGRPTRRFRTAAVLLSIALVARRLGRRRRSRRPG